MDERLNQKEILEYLQNMLSTKIMIPVYGKMSRFGTNAFFQSIITPLEFAESDMKNNNCNRWLNGLKPGFTTYGRGDCEETIYSRYCNDEGIEPFVIYRNYEGLGGNNHVEIVEEFRLLNNLYFDSSKNQYVDLVSNSTVIEIVDELVYVHKTYLKRYLSAKSMVMMIHIDSNYYSDRLNPHSPKIDISRDDENVNYRLISGISNWVSPPTNYSLLYYKILVTGLPIEKCGYWPYDKEDELFEEFIIGIDETGKEVLVTCNPDRLGSFFNDDPSIPNYLTLVFFKREVLRKYYDEPQKYNIEDNYITCGSRWGLRVDNQHDEYICVYLGDLGNDLPDFQEQRHWRIFNIAIDGTLSGTKFKRDFLVQRAEPDSPIFIFQNTYIRLNNEFERQLGWPLFLPLHDGDKYSFKGLRLPIGNGQPEFDALVLALTKVINDSLNEKQIMGILATASDIKTGSINRLEKWFEISNLNDYNKHIVFLRNLQNLRSSSSAHRKGREYEKMVRSLGIVENDNIENFKKLIFSATELLIFIRNNLSKLASMNQTL